MEEGGGDLRLSVGHGQDALALDEGACGEGGVIRKFLGGLLRKSFAIKGVRHRWLRLGKAGRIGGLFTGDGQPSVIGERLSI